MAWTSGLQIKVIEGKNRGRVVELDQEEMYLGRAANKNETAPGHIFFQEPTVSRVHAVLIWNKKKKKYVINHKSRTNPTLVNGSPVEKKMLDVGATIQMGLLVIGLEKADPRSKRPSGRLGGAAQAPPKAPTSVVGPILEVLSQVERQRSSGAEPTAPRKTPAMVRHEEQREREFGWEPPPTTTAISKSEAPSRRSIALDSDYSGGPSARPQDEPDGETSYRLVVVEGPDKGVNFNLDEMVLVIGQRQGFDDNRAGQGVLLNDSRVPTEQGMLVWQGREGTYGLLQSDSTKQAMMVRRVVSGAPKEFPVDTQRPTLLQEGDVILTGMTALAVRRASLTPSSAQRSEPDISMADTLPGKQRSPAAPAQDNWEPARSPFQPAAPASPTPTTPPVAEPEPPPAPAPAALRPPDITPLEAVAAAQAKVHSEEQAGGVVPKGFTPRQSSSPPRRESMGGTPNWARQTQVPAGPAAPSAPPASIDTLSGKETLTRHSGAQRMQPTSSRVTPPSSPNALSWPWKRHIDYVFDFLSGPNHGCQIALTAKELPDGRTITLGSSGERLNDIVIDSFGVSNQQAELRFRDRRFSLLNQGQSGSITVNQVPLKANDQVVLMTGDLVEMGDSIFRFLERETVEVLNRYVLAVESGVTADQDKSFPFPKQRILVGRGKTCDVRLSDLEVSRVHVSMGYRDGQFFIQHRSETNPTFLNGVSLLPGAERILNPGDRIRLSSLTVVRFFRKEPQRRQVSY